MSSDTYSVTVLDGDAGIVGQLADALVETVAGGGSVSFMHPLSAEAAREFWEMALAAAARGERIVLGAMGGDALVGTVTLLLAFPENQPHRCEIAKMMTRPTHRNRGVGTRLLQEAERLALERGKTLVVLDTALDGGASGFYERHGYTHAGTIPDFALKPQGGLTPTMLYWKRLAAKPQPGRAGLVGVIRTSWPHIRFALFRREDGGFEYFEQHVSNEAGAEWVSKGGSAVYGDLDSARQDMMRAVEAFED
jgi:ribosomal protein S18 acetylase RimI-like enzyme